jgi:DNA invertase Pin-like site-specific DNA recombinase
MATQTVTPVSEDVFCEYIKQAAISAGAAYCRQSLDQQAENSRLPEYLLTMAKMAREQGVVVPREYVFYDHETGEHLDRPAMQFLRHELAEKQRIVGILFADLRCLSREPAPQQVFERLCEILGVKLIFGDAPSGMDVGSQFARSALTFSNKLARPATNRNARAGNIGRVLKGWAPSHKAAYGYVYR